MKADRVLPTSYFDVDQLKANFVVGLHRNFGVEELVIVSGTVPPAHDDLVGPGAPPTS
jgi:hypothetical protein